MVRALLSIALAAAAGGCASSLGPVVAPDQSDSKTLCAPRSNAELASVTDLALSKWRPTLRVLELRPEGLERADAKLLGALLDSYRVLGFEPRPASSDVTAVHTVGLRVLPRGARLPWAISPREVGAELLSAVTGEKVPGAREVQVSRTSVDANAAFWAVVTLGVSAPFRSPVKTQTTSERHVPDVAAIAAAAPRAGRLVMLARRTAPAADWFVVPRGETVEVTDELLLSAGPCMITVVLRAPLSRPAEPPAAVRDLPLTSWSQASFRDVRHDRRFHADR
jgi:hypothetical protein